VRDQAQAQRQEHHPGDTAVEHGEVDEPPHAHDRGAGHVDPLAADGVGQVPKNGSRTNSIAAAISVPISTKSLL
jgi:hypothetical protein